MSWPLPISYLQLNVFWAIMAVGAVALIWTFMRSRRSGDAARKGKRSTIGILVQSLGFAAAGFGPLRLTLSSAAASSVLSTLFVALFGVSAVALFISSATAMGRNWSVVARTRSDHQLVRNGPFAVVRHPIYLALLLYLFSLSIAFGHLLNLVIALPLFCVGTIIRIREEEKLLRAQFGDDHARYVREVRAFIPGVF